MQSAGSIPGDSSGVRANSYLKMAGIRCRKASESVVVEEKFVNALRIGKKRRRLEESVFRSGRSAMRIFVGRRKEADSDS